MAVSNIHSNNITFPTSDPKHLIYNPVTATLSFVNFETALTFNNLGLATDALEPHISRTLPTRYQTWSNTWYADWGLSKDTINPFSTGTDGTVFDDEWKDKYAEVVMREPVMPQEAPILQDTYHICCDKSLTLGQPGQPPQPSLLVPAQPLSGREISS